VAIVEKAANWFIRVLGGGNFGSSSLSPAVTFNSHTAKRSFGSFPKMFPLQKGREEREESAR
jgi:hypothetical protein